MMPGIAYDSQASRNVSLDGIAISYGRRFPDDGSVVSLIGSRPDANEGCVPSLARILQSFNSTSTVDNGSIQVLLPIFTESFALLLHRSKCHLRDTVSHINVARRIEMAAPVKLIQVSQLQLL